MEKTTTPLTNLLVCLICLISRDAYTDPLIFTPDRKVGIQTDTPASTLEIGGSIGYKVRTVDTANAIAGNEAIILADTESVGGNINIRLPNAATTVGRVYTIKRTNDDAYTVIVNSTDGIDNGTSLSLTNLKNGYAYASLVSNGKSWLVTGGNGAVISNPTLGIPTDGIVLHLDAETLFLNNNDPVAEWSDPSSTRKAVSQADSTLQPVYIANAINGKPAVRFTGNHVLTRERELINGNGDRTVFVVVKPVNAENSAILSDGTLGLDGGQFTISPEIAVHVSGGERLFENRASTNRASVITVVSGGTGTDNLSAWVNSIPMEETSTSDQEMNVSGKFSVGAITTETGEFKKFFEGDIAEILVYNRILSSAERIGVEEYLIDWWLY